MNRLDFIFMLTRHDRTVPEAIDHVATALAAGIRHIGFKDIGLPFAELRTVHRLIKAGGATSYLEVVSLDRVSEIASVRAAIDLGVDNLLGGTHAEDVLPLLRGTGIRYYPFAGRVSGHPSILEGSVAEIAGSARAIAARDGVDGLDLLAYRSHTDVEALIAAVCTATDKPVLVAGSIERPEQIEAIRRSGAAGFTIGTAALEGRFPASGPALRAQLDAIAACL
ncbi:4-hydroxythreonine-4-phosphate dehydrogenase [Bosea sp. NPDC055353]